MVKDNLISDVIAESPNRRSLLKKIGAATAAVGAGMATGGMKLEGATSSSLTVVDVLQFALNLEYLEAEFYTVATAGKTIDMAPYNTGITGAGRSGATTGGHMVNFSNNLLFTRAVAEEIGQDERSHVTLLRTALSQAGITPIAKPEINLNALGLGFGSESEFLVLARIFEDIGVTAYGGAAQLPIVTNSPYIGTAARILATEAEHVGNIRLQMARFNLTSPKLDRLDLLPPPNDQYYISAAKATGLTEIRTPGQVLYLAYGMMANATAGGFFPNGVNGKINMSTAAA